MSKECSICFTPVTSDNNGLILTKELLSLEEQQRFDMKKKCLCVDCKRELLFANIIAVV